MSNNSTLAYVKSFIPGLANQATATNIATNNKSGRLFNIFGAISSPAGTTAAATTASMGLGAGWGSSLAQMVSYVIGILVVLFVILIFVHYFITPVFSLHPGAPGMIPVPGWDDGVLYWENTNPSQILNKDLPIQNQYCGYSLTMDMFIENPLQFSKQPRILFSRGGNRLNPPSGDTVLGVMNQYNLVVGLLPDTNDMIVSVLNKDYNMENVIVSNVPIQEPFRLGIVLMEQALEVYMNGHLVKTRTFSATPMDVKGDIYPATGVEANIAKIRNLKIWSRILTTSEIRYAKPALSKAEDFNPSPIPSSTSCSAPSAEQNVAQRMLKLSVDTVSDGTSLY